MYRRHLSPWCAPALFTAAALTVGIAHADDHDTYPPQTAAQSTDRDSGDLADQMRDAKQQVREAQKVVERMKQDPKLMSLMEHARGVFIAPDYGKGAAIIGARGGQGVLLVRNDDAWSSPAFYNFGGVTFGAQVGGAGGSFAMLLMNDSAVQPFRNQSDFALNANAGLTVVDYSADTQASAGKGDVIVWSDTKGLFAGASIGISGVIRDEDENRAYYQPDTTVKQVLSGSVKNPDAQMLRDAMPDRMASR